jgi:hypothetical protein
LIIPLCAKPRSYAVVTMHFREVEVVQVPSGGPKKAPNYIAVPILYSQCMPFQIYLCSINQLADRCRNSKFSPPTTLFTYVRLLKPPIGSYQPLHHAAAEGRILFGRTGPEPGPTDSPSTCDCKSSQVPHSTHNSD